MDSYTKRERVRRVSLAVMALTAPLPVAGVIVSGSGLPWALIPATAGIVTVATMRAKRVPAPIPAPAYYPPRMTAQAYVATGPEPEPDPNALRTVLRKLHSGRAA